ncbi:MAG: ketoacyl-ACP synthase III [Bacteroidales bacterium]|nr:ketoacyl-ACP synthase III [Bacteroidales bacterium]
MSLLTFENICISGMSAVVPKNIIDNKSFTNIFTKQEIENAIGTTGIAERRFADKNICSSDLCFEAAEILLSDIRIDRNSIDLLIFVSQTPDYHQPATAPILQHRLGLSKTCGSFDINLACSGYIYGLSTAFAYCNSIGVNRVLLLVGETLSKFLSLKDRATCLLFGDAGSATLIEKNKKYGKSYFSLNSDGSGDWVLKIPAGGYRFQSSEETIKNKEYPDGSIRSDEHLFMDGMEVFNFTMNVVPKDIKKLLGFAEMTQDEIDYLIFHQANKYMTDYLAKRSKFPPEKVPYSLQEFGNTSGVTIPLTIVSQLQKLSPTNKRMVFSGFGGGLSWGSAILDLSDCHISKLKEI